MPAIQNERSDPRDVDRDREEDCRSEDGVATPLQAKKCSLQSFDQIAREEDVSD
jgi:hypothetical protein